MSPSKQILAALGLAASALQETISILASSPAAVFSEGETQGEP